MGKNLEERDLKLERDIRNKVTVGKILKFTIEQIKSFIPERKEIGKGCWGTVYEGMIRGLSGDDSHFNDQRVAVKVGKHLSNESDSSDDKYIQWKSEIMILTSVKHDTVVKLIGVCRTNLGLYLVYPLYERGDLKKNIPNLDWEKGLNVILKVAEGLKVLQEKQLLVCRGFKPSDILLDHNWSPVWTDFGRMIRIGDWPIRGSLIFKDEDVIYKGHLGDIHHYDYYCMGILMLQVLMKEQEADFKVTVMKEEEEGHPDTHSCEYSSDIKERAEKLKDQNSHVVHPDFFETGCTLKIAREITNVALQCLHESGVNQPTAIELVDSLKMIVNPQRKN